MKETKDPIFPSVPRDSFFGTFNLRSLGVAMAIAWFGAMLWSPAVVSPCYREQGLDMHMHVLRFVMLVALCIVYALARMRPAGLLEGPLKRRIVVCGFIVSPLPLMSALFPDIARACSHFFAIDVLLWACGGFSASTIMLVWGYRMGTKKDYGQSTVDVAGGAVFSGVLFLSLSFLQYPVSVILVASLPYFMLVIWLVCSKSDCSGCAGASEKSKEGASSIRTGMRSALGANAPSFVFIYGFVMGMAGAIGTQFAIDRYSPLYVGAALLVAGVGMLYVARMGRLKISGRIFYMLLPSAVACMLLFAVVDGVGEAVLLFAVFAAVSICNVLNTAYEDKGGLSDDALPVSYENGYARFVGESRMADMLGGALGWGAGAVALFAVGERWEPYWYFLMALGLVAVATGVFAFGGNDLMARTDVSCSFESLAWQWEMGCTRLARAHDLSAREEEVFLLLSRGRDRQYIHEALGISPNTVRTHAYNLYRKLGVHDQQQLIDLVEAELSRRGE